MVLAAILSQSVALYSWDIALGFDVNAASTIRRFSRWLHNKNIDIERIYDSIIREALLNWGGNRIILALDTTMLRDNTCAIRISMIYLSQEMRKDVTEKLLFTAGNANATEITRLIQEGADVNAVDNNGSTPLMWAAQDNENPDILRILIEN